MAFTDQTFEAHMGYALGSGRWLTTCPSPPQWHRKLNKRQAVGMALRYFSLGNITFTDVNGTAIRVSAPTSFA